MEYWIAIDGASAAGLYLLSQQGKIGGATGTQQCGVMTHPLIVATDLDWSIAGFVRMTHLQDPGTPNPQPRELVIPSSTVLLATPVTPPANQPKAEQQKPTSSLH